MPDPMVLCIAANRATVGGMAGVGAPAVPTEEGEMLASAVLLDGPSIRDGTDVPFMTTPSLEEGVPRRHEDGFAAVVAADV